MYLKPTKIGNKAKAQPDGTKTEKKDNFKPCINRPFRIRAYMECSYVDQLLLTNLFKFEVNIFKILMKTKDRIK